MPQTLATLNLKTAVTDAQGNATAYLARFLLAMAQRIESAAFAAAGQIVSYSAQAAAIATTALVIAASLPLYRVSYEFVISQAAGVSSSVALTVSWTQNGVAQNWAFAAETGNLTTSKQSDSKLIRPDAGTNISYAIAYASVGAPVANYEFVICAEAIG